MRMNTQMVLSAISKWPRLTLQMREQMGHRQACLKSQLVEGRATTHTLPGSRDHASYHSLNWVVSYRGSALSLCGSILEEVCHPMHSNFISSPLEWKSEVLWHWFCALSWVFMAASFHLVSFYVTFHRPFLSHFIMSCHLVISSFVNIFMWIMSGT